MATRLVRQPFMEAVVSHSYKPVFCSSMMVDVNMAVRPPAAAPGVVLLTAASDAVWPSALELTSKTDPQLNPYQPNQRLKVPRNYVLSDQANVCEIS